MNAAVILAAGDSSRMGFPKQLAEVKEKSLLQLIIDKVNNKFEYSSVVLGSENEVISEKVDFKNSNILINENWSEGITSSIRTSLFFYQGQKEIDNVIFFLADQPEVESEVIDGLINDDHDGTKILIPQYRYKLGFPILVPRLFWPKLELITQDDDVDEEKSVFQDFDLIDFFISSETETKNLNFNFLEPIDYDEEKDF
ncbi:MAG: NTP transferase domain-containing protein [Candidatus Actinomarina sp.]|uniref:Putative MobA-related protein n=1 Tax=Candidatus Actinomarina minuta TaxID=1389454 RepID=S5DJG9_9ACTN|nr:putative MobA-related protein [Candidatus Actinomarina minuta]|tara:strand:+ start:2071 stop:2667 length:597 start_codon:yes stop_codon:yes gene_type:complete